MINKQQTRVHNRLHDAILKVLGKYSTAVDIEVRPCKDRFLGDYHSPIALRLGKILSVNPRTLAEKIKLALLELELDSGVFSKIDVAGPGYLNLTLIESKGKNPVPQDVVKMGIFLDDLGDELGLSSQKIIDSIKLINQAIEVRNQAIDDINDSGDDINQAAEAINASVHGIHEVSDRIRRAVESTTH